MQFFFLPLLLLLLLLSGSPAFAAYQTGAAPTFVFSSNSAGGTVVTNSTIPVTKKAVVKVVGSGGGAAYTGAAGALSGSSDFARLMSMPLNGGKGVEFGGKYNYAPRVSTPNTTIPISVVQKVPFKSVAKALLRSLPGIGTVYVLGELADEYARHGNEVDPHENSPWTVEQTPTGWTVTRDETVDQAYLNSGAGPYESPGTACTALAESMACHDPGCEPPPSLTAIDNRPAVYSFSCALSSDLSQIAGGGVIQQQVQKIPLPESVIDDEIQPDGDPAPGVADGIVMDALRGNAPWQLEIPDSPAPEVTGPGTVSNSVVTTTNAAGNTVTNTTVTTINYNDNRVTVNNTTTTVTKNPSGTTIPNDPADVPADETSAEPEPPTDLCKDHPEILACQELDTPSDEPIPKDTRNITLQTGPTFGGGGCIPDVVVNVGGQQITVLAMTVPCGWIENLLKPFILLIATISAVYIVMPRAGD